MTRLVAALALAASALVPTAVAQVTSPSGPPATPLASKHFTWSALPYQADTGTGDRGTQQGYNLCNSTTEGPTSMCQTAVINGIDDFCLWGSATPNQEIGVIEGEAVAWCTKRGYGTRLIPQGALTGVQYIKTPDYVQITGLIKQDQIYIAANDSGGELDPHGADERGNPLGALVFSTGFNGQWTQAVEWHNFMGGNQFCLKACDPAGPNAAHYCEHIFDRIGCMYNAPAAYQDGVFLSCLGASQDFPGVYTGSDNKTTTYVQPAESLGPIMTMPYQPKLPATSSCTTYSSAALYASAPAATISESGSTNATAASSHATKVGTATHSSASTAASGTTGAAARGVSAGALGSLAAVLGAPLLAALAL